jgi:nicotinamidase-related amidase
MARTALIVVDMLSPYDHEDAEKLAASVAEQLPQMVELRDRAARAEDTLTVYVNDNYERWHSMREDLIRSALDGRRPDLVEPLLPDEAAPFIAKGRHSIFYQTSVDHLLQVEQVKRVVLCGQVTEQCIQYSALDAYMRGYEVSVPSDAVAHIEPEWARTALEMMAKNMHADLTSVADGALDD